MDEAAAAAAAAMAGIASFQHGSPFPDAIDEDKMTYHGGTASAGQAGLLSKAEMKLALAAQNADVAAVAAAGGRVTLGLTIYPP